MHPFMNRVQALYIRKNRITYGQILKHLLNDSPLSRMSFCFVGLSLTNFTARLVPLKIAMFPLSNLLLACAQLTVFICIARQHGDKYTI